MSLTNHGKHAKATPRGGSSTMRRRGLVAAALALLVAVIVAVPALVAMAADEPLQLSVAPKDPSVSPVEVDGAAAYADNVTYTVTLTAKAGVSLVTDDAKTTVSGSAPGTVSWDETSPWTFAQNDDGTTTYTRDVVIGESTKNAITVSATYTVTEETTDPGEEGGENPDGETTVTSEEKTVTLTDSNTLVTVDKSSPKVFITMSAPRIGHDPVRGLDYYDVENLTATVSVEDATFDAKKSTITVTKLVMDETLENPGWTLVDGKYQVVVPCADISDISVNAVDLVDPTNHVTTYEYGQDDANLGDSFDINTSKPSITFTVYDEESGETLYNGTDLRSTHFNQDVRVKAEVTMDPFGDVTGLEGWGASGEGITRTYEKTFSVDDEGTKEIEVTALQSGFFEYKKISNTLSITLDKTAPTVSVSYNLTPENADATTGPLYFDTQSGSLTATITADEANSFDAGSINVTLNGNPVEGVFASGQTGTVTFEDDGTFELNVTGADLAGNPLVPDESSPVSLPSNVVTDSKAPVIDVSYFADTNGDGVLGEEVFANENGLINKVVIPRLEITDANFDPTNTTVTFDGMLPPTQLTWENDQQNPDLWTAELDKVSLEGVAHVINVTSTDKVGHTSTVNPAAEGSPFSFIIDTTPLVLNVTWIDDPEPGQVEKDENGTTTYYPSARTAKITPSDMGFNISDVHIVTGGPAAEWDEEEQAWFVRYAADGAYELYVGEDSYDLAGNNVYLTQGEEEGECLKIRFVIDTQAPTFSVSGLDASVEAEGDDARYFADETTAQIKVSDLNFYEDGVEVTVNGVEVDDLGWNPSEDPSDPANTHVASVTFENDADAKTLEVSVVDKANNPAESYDNAFSFGPFVVDTVDPVATLTVDPAASNKAVSSVDYYNMRPTFTLTVADANFDPAATTLVIDGTEYAGDQFEWRMAGTDDASGTVTWETELGADTVADGSALDLFGEGVGHTLSASVLDKADHGTSADYTKLAGNDQGATSFTVDLTAPEVSSVSVDTNPSNNYGENYYFNLKTQLTINVTDAIGLVSLSMDDAEGVYVLDNNVSTGATEGSLSIGFQDGHDFDRDVIVTSEDLAGNQRTWSISPSGIVTELGTSHGEPNEPVDDANGDDLSDIGYPESMLQDTVAPVVALSGVTPGTYYNSSQSVTLSVVELNIPILRTFEPGQVVLTVTRVAGDASGATSTWTRPLSQLAGSNSNYSLVEPLSADGHYVVSAQVTDPARNKGTDEIGEFTIDQTAPVVDVTFDNNDVRNGKYYNAARTATVTVTEHNFDPSLVALETNGAVGSWSTNGDVHTIQVSFASDGVYNLAISGADMAGNAMTPYQADEFVVDTQAPEITFGGVEDATAYNGDVEPTITFVDEANFDANGTSYTVTGSKNGTVEFESFVSSQDQGQTVSYSNFVREPDVDDIYTIDAHMSDLAGNEAEGTITFSVNRFGSTFRVLDAGSYTENDGYLTERRDVVVEEVNVSGVASEQHGVTVTEGTNVTELVLNPDPQETGYTIESATSTDPESNGWSVYTYRVAAGNFVRDGRYHVSVESEDLASNTNTSSNYYDRAAGENSEAEVDFILDTTDPVITSLNIESGATYDSASYEGSFTVVENIGVREVVVLVDGDEVEATDDGYGTYTFQVEAKSFTPRSLEITATDLSGRTGSASADEFHVTTDIFELHLPLVVTGIVAVVVIAAGAVYFLVVKPKRDEDEKKAA